MDEFEKKLLIWIWIMIIINCGLLVINNLEGQDSISLSCKEVTNQTDTGLNATVCIYNSTTGNYELNFTKINSLESLGEL